jgi:hypothetical protein
MKQAVFITGFNNWGKSEIIFSLFGNRRKYYQGWTYPLSEVNFNTEFTVESHSNDDWWGQNWLDHVQERIDNSPDNGQNLFTALCPTLHETNNFIELLTSPLFAKYDKLHIFLIEHKYEHHAKLMIDKIISVGQQIPNVNFIVINADQNLINDDDRKTAKHGQIRQELNNIFGK